MPSSLDYFLNCPNAGPDVGPSVAMRTVTAELDTVNAL